MISPERERDLKRGYKEKERKQNSYKRREEFEAYTSVWNAMIKTGGSAICNILVLTRTASFLIG